jgi:hypothetical protein
MPAGDGVVNENPALERAPSAAQSIAQDKARARVRVFRKKNALQYNFRCCAAPLRDGLRAPLLGGAGVQRVLAVEDPLVVGRGRNPGIPRILLCHTVSREALPATPLAAATMNLLSSEPRLAPTPKKKTVCFYPCANYFHFRSN